MALDFKTEPYFDDYEAEKDFYRILFRPSYAVQARELTQIQTILQNQVTRFGDHVFKNGSQVIPGSVNVDNKVHFVKLEKTNGSLEVSTYLSSFNNKIITGVTSGVKMVVVGTTNDSSVVDDTTIPTLYCKVIDSGFNAIDRRFEIGEQIIAYAADNQISTNFRLKEDQLDDIDVFVKSSGNAGETATVYSNSYSSDVMGYGYSVDVKAGIYYINGIFVRNDDLKLYVGRFTNNPSCRVGFKVTEETITPEDDESILDNATGSYNFAAPGAHRYKITLSLVKLDLVTTDNINFIELVRIVEGRVQHKIEKATYAELEKTFARRTFDESGNYEVNKYKLSIREHLNDGTNLGAYVPDLGGDINKFVMSVDPGKAYIQGYEVESTASQFVEFNKARKIGTDEGNHIQRIPFQKIGLNIGNYVRVSNLYNYPAIDTFENVYLVKKLQPKMARLRAIVTAEKVTSIVVDDGGEGYTGTPTITISRTGSGTGTDATATATVVNGKITAVTVGNPSTNTGYTTVPEVYAINNISLGAAPTAADIVGTARVKSIQLNSGDYSTRTSSVYKLGLFDINMFKGFSFERDVKSITGIKGSQNFTCDISPIFTQLIGSGTATSGTNYITGTGTNFLDVVKAGDVVYLNDIKIGYVGDYTFGGSDFNNLKLTLTANYTGTTVSGGRITIFKANLEKPSYETLLFPVGQSVVKTLKGNDGTGDTLAQTSMTVRRLFPQKQALSNSIEFSVTGDETFSQSESLSNYLLVDVTTGMPVNLTESTISLNESYQTVTISGLIAEHYYYLIASVFQETEAGVAKVKVIHRNHPQTITGKKNVSSSSIKLQYADVLKLVSVMMTPGDFDTYNPSTAVDITDRYTLDNGQRSTYYTYGSLLLNAGQPVPTGCIRVTYDYFSTSGIGNYFSVDSYLTTAGVTYEEIPSYYVTDPTTGKKVEISLTDVVDFRPMLVESNSFYPNIPMIGSDMLAPIANYLGRIDKVVLDSVGKFNVIKGVPSYSPKEPADPKEGMVIATVSIPPYTKSIKDVVINQRDNRRYTMRDIGNLERRISNLEYYVTLNLLEKDTATMQIRDTATNLDRFKNGFIVDQFTGHGIGDVKHADYRVAVDSTNRVLRPMATEYALELVEQLTTGLDRNIKDYQKTGDLITLPYETDAYIFNNHATRAMDIHALSMGAFKGQISLYPESDSWKSVDRRPDLVAVDDNNYDAIKFIADAAGVTGTKWDEWQTNWTSIVKRAPVKSTTKQWTGSNILASVYETTYTDYTGYNSREGIDTSLTSSINGQDYGDRVVDMSYIPFMRARPITFIARNLKKNSQFWSFFDGTSVENYVVPADIFKVTRVSQSVMSFNIDDFDTNLKSDIPARAHNGRIEQAFSFGDVITNSTHTATKITQITNLSLPASSFSLKVSNASGIRPGHHVVLYNLDYHNAYDTTNLDDLNENQIIPVSSGINSNTATSKELNLRKFKVLSVVDATEASNAIVTLGHIDGSEISAFSAYSTASYAGENRGMLLRLKASGVVSYDGIIEKQDVIGVITQYLHVTNIKNGFSVGEALTGSVSIGINGTTNSCTIDSINGSEVVTAPATMKDFGDNLITDEDGTIVGVFHLPEDDTLSFRTGERTFKLTDNQSNSNASFDSIGSATYYAQGISLAKERTIVSTRTAEFVQAETYEDTKSLPPVRRTTASTRLLYQYTYDPLAQTFTVSADGGVFVTSVDLYFSAKGTRPVTIELRNTSNGTPSSKIVPFSQVTKTASELNVSSNSSVATNFKFKSPIYLQDTETYCIVVMTDEPGTQVYVSEMGGTDMLTKNTIAGQPLTGSLYASQNAKEWEIHPLLDLKFVLNKATFDITKSPAVTFNAIPPMPMQLGTNPFEITPNTTKVRVYAKNHGFKKDEIVVISGVTDGLYGSKDLTKGIPHTLLNSKHTVLETGLDRDSFIIDINTVSEQNPLVSLLSGTTADFTKGLYGGNGVVCSRSINMDLLYLKSSDLNFQETKIDYYVQAEKLEGTSQFTPFMPFVANSNYTFPNRMHICSVENQKTVGESVKPSLQIKAVLNSTNPNVSPALDIQAISAYAISNLIDSKTADNINVAEIDTRKLLAGNDLVDSDISIVGTNTVYINNGSTALNGSSTSFTTQVFPGNIIKKADGTIIGVVSTVNSNTSITLTANYTGTTIASPGVAYGVFSTPSLSFTNTTVGGVSVGMISTNIDTADNLLASAGIGKVITIANVATGIDGTYSVRDINVVEDKTTYAGNADGDTTRIILDRAFTATTTINMQDLDNGGSTYTEDTDFIISVLDKYVDDYAPYGSHNASNYVTRTLSLSQAATTIKVMFDANIVNNTEVKVYYRTWSGNVDLRNIPYKDTGFVSTNLDPEGTFVERSIDVEDIEAFNNVSIKVVLKSTDPVFVPKLKNLRLLALS